MKPSEIIVERLRTRGYEIHRHPRRIHAGHIQRTAGAASWFATVLTKEGARLDVLSWCTMTEVARCPDDKMVISQCEHFGDLHIDVPREYWAKK